MPPALRRYGTAKPVPTLPILTAPFDVELPCAVPVYGLQVKPFKPLTYELITIL